MVEPRSELMVFNKKEVSVIVVLLVLVALFSFTLGLRLGRNLGETAATHSPTAPIHGTAPLESAPAAHESGKTDHSATAGHGAAAHEAEAEDLSPAEIEAKKAKTAADLSDRVEQRADAELAAEAKQGKVGMAKPVSMAFPKDKRPSLESGKFTLQVGSHRTVAEAAEQVSVLKKSGLEAFYLEVQIPGKGTWYRVGVGAFDTKEAAESAAAQWKSTKRLPPFIVQALTHEQSKQENESRH